MTTVLPAVPAADLAPVTSPGGDTSVAALCAAAPTLADQALLALAVHRMLTIEQLRQLLTPEVTTTTNWSTRLNKLRRAGLIRDLQYRGAHRQKIWCCTRAGLRVVLRDPDQLRAYEVPEQGGILAAHTLAVNEAGLAFARAARARGDECDWFSWEHEVAHRFYGGRQARSLIADAVLDYTLVDADDGGGVSHYFVELDRATEPVPRLVKKLRGYATYRRWIPNHPEGYGLPPGQPAWRARYHQWPVTCVVIGANNRKAGDAIERRIDQLLALCAGDAVINHSDDVLPVLVCNFDDLVHRGPWEPIWTRTDNPTSPVTLAGRPSSGPTVS